MREKQFLMSYVFITFNLQYLKLYRIILVCIEEKYGWKLETRFI